MKKFNIPNNYRGSFVAAIKNLRKIKDPRKQDLLPSLLDFGPVEFLLARHFGFCYGVENAIEIAYKAVEENPGKRIFLLSQMIHNPDVNEDLLAKGVQFIMDTHGKQFIAWDVLQPEDIVIIPAFGTTIEIENLLKNKNIPTQKYNTTCPFVEKVWKKSNELGKKNYSVIIHGKAKHEETRATFSHAANHSPTLIIEDLTQAKILGEFIQGTKNINDFFTFFDKKTTPDFDPIKDLQKIGVVNQTTMLASETQAIAELLKEIIKNKYQENWNNHFFDTRDTLCYATNDNQEATYVLLKEKADFAIVAGGYNSSNTSHLVELCEQQLPTFFITDAREIKNQEEIQHFDIHQTKLVTSHHFLPKKEKIKIILTSGASCPDRILDEIMDKILNFFPNSLTKDELLENLKS